MKLIVKSFLDSQETGQKPKYLQETDYEVFLWTTKDEGGFPTPSLALKLRFEAFTFLAHSFSVDNMPLFSYKSLNFGEFNGQLVGARLWKSPGADGIDFELLLGIKQDYMMYFTALQLRRFDMNFLPNQGELELKQILANLRLSMHKLGLVAIYWRLFCHSQFQGDLLWV